MTLLNRRPALRWLVPLLAVAVLALGGSAVAAISASASGSLPPRTAAQLLVDVQKAQLDNGLSGTVVQSASLGLPSLPGPAGDQSSNFSSLVSGSHTLRVWYAGPQQVRVALLGQLGESDLIRNGSNVWIWSSHDNTARQLTVPAHSKAGASSPMSSADQAMTPQQAADAALKAITPTTRVTTDSTAVVAGRSAYQLVLQPRDPATLIGSVRIAIDGKTHVPLRVQVFARGASTPAFETGFTSFNPTAPPASVFQFNPPPGATVTHGLGTAPETHSSSPAHANGQQDSKPEVVGSGWTSVVKAEMPATDSNGSGHQSSSAGPLGNLGAMVGSLPTVSGSWGTGHLLRGTLFSVLVTDKGQVVAGAVAPDRLYAALSAP